MDASAASNSVLRVDPVMGELSHERRERLRISDDSLLTSSPDPIWLIGSDGLVEEVSPVIEDVLGYPAGNLQSTNVFALIHPDDQESLADHCARVLDGEGSTLPVHVRYHHAEGRWLMLEAGGQVVRGGAGRSGLMMVTRDVIAELEQVPGSDHSEHCGTRRRSEIGVRQDVVRQMAFVDNSLRRVQGAAP